MRGYTSARGYDRLDYQLRQTRRLYNAAREHRISAYFRPGYNGGPRQNPERVTLYSQQRDLTELRAANPEWAAVDAQVGRGALRRCERAFQRFFKDRKEGRSAGYPKAKDNAHWRTIEIEDCSPAMVRVSPDGKRAKIAVKGLPIVKVRVRRPLPPATSLKKIALTRRGRRLTANLTYALDALPTPQPPLVDAAGIDLGVTDRIVASDGLVIPAADDRTHRRRLRVLQRRMARRRKGSGGRRKARAALARTHARHRTRRRNEDHRITTTLIRRYGVIAYEALRVSNMTRSAKGSIEQPGTNVRAKSGLNRLILSQRWATILGMMKYKGDAQGRTLVAVDPAYTSQACSRCGWIDASARQGKRYACSACGLTIDADLNASRTILLRGLMALDGPIDRPWDAQEGGHAATTPALAEVVPEIRTEHRRRLSPSSTSRWIEPATETAAAQVHIAKPSQDRRWNYP